MASSVSTSDRFFFNKTPKVHKNSTGQPIHSRNLLKNVVAPNMGDVCGTRSSMLAGLSCTKGVWYIYDWDTGSTILIW